jgi:hypothetical protein
VGSGDGATDEVVDDFVEPTMSTVLTISGFVRSRVWRIVATSASSSDRRGSRRRSRSVSAADSSVAADVRSPSVGHDNGDALNRFALGSGVPEVG